MGTAELEEQIAALAAADLSVAPAALGDEILVLIRLRTALSAQISRRVVAFERADGHGDEQVTVAGWLRTQTTMSHPQAAGEKRVARFADRMPILGAAYAAGEVTAEHLRAVEIVLRKLPQELWDEVDEPLSVVGRTKTPAELAEWLRELAQNLMPVPKPRDETLHEQRRLSVSQGYGGMTNIVGRVTPEVGEKLVAALSAASRPDGDGEIRLPNQRKADALDRILDVNLGAGLLPVDGGEKPHITLMVDLDTISDPETPVPDHVGEQTNAGTSAGSSVAESVAAAMEQIGVSKPRFSWTGPADVSTARRLTCDGVVLPIFTRGGEPLDAGRRTRVVSSAQRAVVVARDQHCIWSGCRMPARWCEAHHVHHWADGGPTDVDHLGLLCPEHHKAAHSGRFVVTLTGPGQILVRRRRPGEPLYEIRLPSRGSPGQQACLLRDLETDAGRLRQQ